MVFSAFKAFALHQLAFIEFNRPTYFPTFLLHLFFFLFAFPIPTLLNGLIRFSLRFHAEGGMTFWLPLYVFISQDPAEKGTGTYGTVSLIGKEAWLGFGLQECNNPLQEAGTKR
ncbi:hypothetical protein BX600DRAFT_308470 [Xylariales sp. PMI_506]|nr:hypothetical protein BX600DRAFT_308470 [Xylariales sp. PMI_506]